MDVQESTGIFKTYITKIEPFREKLRYHHGESEILSDWDIQNPQMCTNNTDNMLLHNMDQWTKIHKYVMYTSVQAHIKLKWILASRNLTKINI